MKILITGIAGFLGGRFAHWLLDHVPDAIIYGIDDYSCGYPDNVPGSIPVYPLTLGEGQLRPGHPAWRRYDYIFHYAAYAAEGLSPFIRQYNYRNNLLATAEVVNMAVERGCQRLVFTSSMAVYGHNGVHGPDGKFRRTIEGDAFCYDEGNSCHPIDPYGIAKLAAEQDIRCAGEQHGLDWCVIRPHNLYGPGQSIWQTYRNVLGLWMRRHYEGQPLLIYGDGQQQRAFSWIDDCLPCLWLAATVPDASKQIINLGGARPVTIETAARRLAVLLPGVRIEHAAPRHEVKEAWCTTAKSERLLGYRETLSLTEGLERMHRWARDAYDRHPERREAGDRFDVEITRGIYPYWAQRLGITPVAASA